MSYYPFSELYSDTLLVLNNNPTQTDADFTRVQVERAINLAYRRETMRSMQHGMRRFFQKTQTFTWPASTLQLALPTNINSTNLIALRDITYDTNSVGTNLDVFWFDSETLQYGTQGPNSDLTIRAHYYAMPQEMRNDSDEPTLIPPEFREILVWSSACYLRAISDEQVPPEWKERLTEWRQALWSHLGKGRPKEDVPVIMPQGGVLTGSLQTAVSALPQDGSSITP